MNGDFYIYKIQHLDSGAHLMYGGLVSGIYSQGLKMEARAAEIGSLHGLLLRFLSINAAALHDDYSA